MVDVKEKYRLWRLTPESVVVMVHVRRLAKSRVDRGKPFGMKAIAEVLRWEIEMSTEPDVQGFKINNTYVSLMGRELVKEEPSWARFIRFRKLASERTGFPPEWMGQIQSHRRMIPTIDRQPAYR